MDNIDINKIVASNKVSFGKKNFKCSILNSLFSSKNACI